MKFRMTLDWLLGRITPMSPEHKRTLARADAILADPVVRKLLNQRESALRASAQRAGVRLTR